MARLRVIITNENFSSIGVDVHPRVERAVRQVAHNLVQILQVLAQADQRLEKYERPETILSDRERDVFMLLGEGLSNQQIAERLSIARSTVKRHVSSVLRKLNVESRRVAAALARRQEL